MKNDTDKTNPKPQAGGSEMSTGYENLRPSPLEYFHGLIMEDFHKWRVSKGAGIEVSINGEQLNKILARSKIATYREYVGIVSDKAIPLASNEGEKKCDNCEEPAIHHYCQACRNLASF
jgi:hypothetical protein